MMAVLVPLLLVFLSFALGMAAGVSWFVRRFKLPSGRNYREFLDHQIDQVIDACAVGDGTGSTFADLLFLRWGAKFPGGASVNYMIQFHRDKKGDLT